MLTRNVAEVEKYLSVRLFERDRRTVTVTDAGRVYVKNARLAILYGERACQAAQAAAQNADMVLNIGRSPYTDPFLISMLQSLQLPLFPELRIEFSSQHSCDLIHDLLTGGLDLAVATEPPKSRLLTTLVSVLHCDVRRRRTRQSSLCHAERPG
jgi:DNA-binding transcriptional LysR family regulator